MNSNHCQLFTILIGFRTASPNSVLAGMPAKVTGKKIKRVDIEGFIARHNWNITEGLKIFNC